MYFLCAEIPRSAALQIYRALIKANCWRYSQPKLFSSHWCHYFLCPKILSLTSVSINTGSLVKFLRNNSMLRVLKLKGGQNCLDTIWACYSNNFLTYCSALLYLTSSYIDLVLKKTLRMEKQFSGMMRKS